MSITSQGRVRLLHGWKFLTLLKRLTVGQAVPEILLSVGSLLLRAFLFAKFPYTSPTLTHLSAYAYCRVLSVYWLYIMYMTGVLHFSALMSLQSVCILPCKILHSILSAYVINPRHACTVRVIANQPFYSGENAHAYYIDHMVEAAILFSFR